MNREELSDLLKRYLDSTCTEEEKKTIDFWYNHFDLKEGSDTERTAQPQMQEFIWQQVRDKINSKNKSEEKANEGNFRRNRFLQFAMAASVIIIGGLAYYHTKINNIPASLAMLDRTSCREVNNSAKVKTVYLEDGSRVDMQPGCSIHYPKPFRRDKREVHLEGEAYFNVTKNVEKPFVVYAGDIATKVVGTSFIIRSGKKNFRDVEVSVITGKVIVEKNESAKEKSGNAVNNGVILTPNQKVVYYHADNHFVTGLVDMPVVIKAPEELNKLRLFRFEETPLHEVLEKLQYAYGLKFELINENISNCPVTADLSDQSLYTKLDIISASLNAHYELKGTSIVLSGGRCD
ncbi:FecR family protein [Dyadobacter frigoris]|nr:FecR family protein [Dyadobacter frigoris]